MKQENNVNNFISFSDSKTVFLGKKYRITVLSDVLLRLEYDETGHFNDYKTLNVVNRNFPFPKFEIKTNDEENLIIETYSFKLEYKKEKEFKGSKFNPEENLKVFIKQTNKYWYFDNPEVRNMSSVPFSNEGDITKAKLKKGLYSIDGFAILDDSETNVYTERGISKATSSKIDIYLFAYGKLFEKALNSYYTLTGSPLMLPKYAFGIWWNKNDNYSVDKIKDINTNFKINNIPYSVFLLSSSWHIASGSFTFDKKYISNKNLVLNDLANNNVKLALEIDPFSGISQEEEKINEFKTFLKTNTASIIPFNVYDMSFINAFLNTFIKDFINNNITTFLIKTKSTDKKMEYIFIDYLNNYIRANNKRGIILSKNTDYATQRNSILYSDEVSTSFNNLDYLPYLNLNAQNIGVDYWSHAIGGFFGGKEDPELYIRYIEFACFNPIFRLASDYGRFYKREPWKWDVKTFEVSKKYMRLRYKLIPYLYTACYLSHRYANRFITPIYHLNYDIVNEPQYKNEYLLSSELLVCPITTKKDMLLNRNIHKFYLPEGKWYEFNSGNKYEGNKRYIKLYKDEDYPVFIKEGGILPLGIIDNKDLNNTLFNKELEIHLFPGKENNYNLYEDDGESYNYLNGEFILTNFNYKTISSGFELNITPVGGKRGVIPDERSYKFVFRNIADTSNISITQNNNDLVFTKEIEDKNLIIKVDKVSTYLPLKVLLLNTKEIDNLYKKEKEIENIISEFNIETSLKEEIYNIVFSSNITKVKKSLIRKLKKKNLNEFYVEKINKLIDL